MATQGKHTPEQISAGWTCKKRDGKVVPFDCDKIRLALQSCFDEVDPFPDETGDAKEAKLVALTEQILRGLVNSLKGRKDTSPDVELVQQLAIQQLWAEDLFEVAESYQNYREERRKLRDQKTAAIFGRRLAFKPFDYPDTVKFKKAIHKSAAVWTADDFDFTADVQDMKVYLTPAERSAVTRSVLAVSQIEVAVKRFWLKLGDTLPRPEFDQVGAAFADSEVRHADGYSKILDAMNLNSEFQGVTQVPAIKRRIEYMQNAMRSTRKDSERAFAKTVAAFSLLVENVSLFSQFAIIKSFSRKTGHMQNVDNVVQATMKEELVHALFGAWLTNTIRAERPEWFTATFYRDLARTCRASFEAELGILDWIFAEGEVSTVSRATLAEFIKERINLGMTWIGGKPVYDIDRTVASELDWFREELVAPVDVDFFHKKATNYTSRSVTATDLFSD